VGAQRLLCLFDYFTQAEQHLERANIEFKRADFDEWDFDSETELNPEGLIEVHDDRMEKYSGNGSAFVDFANKKLMIHRIIPSLTQEEVLFSCASELFLTLIFVPVLNETEAFVMQHCWRHCDYTGYLDSFKYRPLEEPWIEDVIAIDALTYKHFTNSVRDLKKCYVGFKAVDADKITTGRWGCGVFGGDKQHKFLQQLMVAQMLGKKLYYSSYKDVPEMGTYQQLVQLLATHRVAFGWLLSKFVEFPRVKGNGFHVWICEEIKALPKR
jgi:poly(ADP-ribose) glycohydrolase